MCSSSKLATSLSLLALLSACASRPPERAIEAPLVVSTRNPRYFEDGRGRTVRLAGHQIFVDLQDHPFDKPRTIGGRERLDWGWYLDFAVERDLNFLRSWTVWSTGSGHQDPARTTTPMMYLRTGPGRAADGGLRFDLTRFDEAFFERMLRRAEAAQECGLYLSVMLFEPYGFFDDSLVEGEWLFRGNVFNGRNNVNGIDVDEDGDGGGLEFFGSSDPRVRALQLAYVDKVVDTLAGLDNVLYELANEVHAPEWQRAIVEHIRRREAGRARQHLIYRSPGGRTADGSWRDASPAQLVASGADVVGVCSAFGDFEHDPPVDRGERPVIWDNDHIWGEDYTHRRRAWMALTRGYHFIFYDAPFERPGHDAPAHELMRRNIGATNRYARRFEELARMDPHGELASSGYCLADPGAEYLVYSPSSAGLELELAEGSYDAEWYDCLRAEVHSTGRLEAARSACLVAAPAGIAEDYVLYLRRR